MQCELCGSEEANIQGLIEETEMVVCDSCAKYAKDAKKIEPKIEEPPKTKTEIRIQPERKEPSKIITIVEDYSEKLKKARETRGITQKELAKEISEKEPLFQRIESGKDAPSLKLAEKLERFFNITLIEEVEIEKFSKNKQQEHEKGLTLGDVIKFKERKRR